MATATVGVATVVNSGKLDAGHLDTLATGMDFEDNACMGKATSQRAHDSWPHPLQRRSLAESLL
eukprot:5346408-Amphidinium_carterae.1